MGPWLPFLLNLLGAPRDPQDLAQSVEARWASEGLLDSVGTLYEDRAGPGATPPHAIFGFERGEPYLLTSSSAMHWYRITFRVRDLTEAGAREKAARVAGAFDGISLFWDGGKAGRLTREAWEGDAEASFSPGTRPAYLHRVEYTARVEGAR